MTLNVPGRILLAVALAGCSGRACGGAKLKEDAVYNRIVSPDLAFFRFDAPSSQCAHASGTRSGRVVVLPRTYVEFVELASDEQATGAMGVPRVIALPPRGENIVVERSSVGQLFFDVRSRSGQLMLQWGASTGRHVFAQDDRVFLGNAEVSWSGARGSTFGWGAAEGGELLAWAATPGEILTLATSRSAFDPHGGPRAPDSTCAETSSLGELNTATWFRWRFEAGEAGVGAIDGANHTILALPSGRFVVLHPDGDEKKDAILAVDTAVEPNATDLSIVPPFAMVLYGGGDAGELVASRDASFSTSRLDARRPDGSLAWHASVGFLAEQPPVDGTDRVYVVGNGIAALDLEGRELWSSASTVTLRAAAFGDGTLAVARGNELQIVGKDGSIRQAFRAIEKLTSYPAIAADGTVWVSSAKSLYVAR